jgi:hypothetical protein
METSADSDSSWDPQKDETGQKITSDHLEIPVSWDTPYSKLKVGGFAVGKLLMESTKASLSLR